VVIDAERNPLCYFTAVFAVLWGGFRIQSTDGRRLGVIESDDGGGRYHLRKQNGENIGVIEDHSMSGEEPSDFERQAYSVTVNDTAGSTTMARLLLLAGALTLDIIYRARVGSPKEAPAQLK
jgi:hypothetical protein